MGRFTELIFGKRDAVPAPYRMIGFPSDGGLIPGGVTSTTVLGLSAVARCLDILTNGVSQLDWQEKKGTLDWPISRIVKSPHPEITRRDWTSFVVASMALFDRSYILPTGGVDAEGVPFNLLPIDPSYVTPASVNMMQFVSPLIPASDYWIGTEKVPSSALLILNRGPLPGVTETTMGVIRLARTMFATAIAAEGYASRYWQSGGSPTTALQTDQKLMPNMAEELQKRWRESRQRGPDTPAVLEGGIKAVPFGADPTTESAVEARRELVADIARFFGVPTRIVNAPTGDSETYTNSESANLDLVRFTLENYIGAIQDAITGLLPGGRRMEMNTGKLTAGPMAARAQAANLATASKAWLSVDEVREEFGYGPAENPDELNPPAPVPVVAGGQENGGQG